VRPLIAVVLTAVVGATLAAPVPKAAKKKDAPLDGTWLVTEAVYGGVAQDVRGASCCHIAGEEFTVGSKVPAGGVTLKLVRPDPKNPRFLDYRVVQPGVADTVFCGLVEVSDDEMRFCYGVQDGDRPTELKPGPDVTYRVYKQVTAGAK
jgi:uncharacterized protein (TIGR03067 family)